MKKQNQNPYELKEIDRRKLKKLTRKPNERVEIKMENPFYIRNLVNLGDLEKYLINTVVKGSNMLLFKNVVAAAATVVIKTEVP